MSAIDGNTALYLAQQLGPQKVAEIVEQVEAEKTAEYHYKLGQLMATGFNNEIQKQAMPTMQQVGAELGLGAQRAQDALLAAPGAARDLLLSGVKSTKELKYLRDVYGLQGGSAAAKYLAKGLALPAATVGSGYGVYRGGKAILNRGEEEKTSSDEAVELALEVLAEAGFDVSKLGVPGDSGEEKQSQDQLLHAAIQVLDDAGVDIDKLAMKQDYSDLDHALAVCAQYGIHYQE